MKRILIIKMSSMGDIIHTLPALTDAKNALKEVEFDWVVEPSFSEIPRWHTAVNHVIPAPLRRWRRSPWQSIKQNELKDFLKKLRQVSYDVVLDAQGLLKSALIAKLAKGSCVGFDHKSARGGLISVVYNRCFNVSQGLHAVEKVRQLFAQALNYPMPSAAPHYGIDCTRLPTLFYGTNTVILLHGTTWTTKHWPEEYWQRLGYLAANAGYQVLLPWGNENERLRAMRISDYSQSRGVLLKPQVLPKFNLGEITSLIAKAKGVVSVDTGLAHVAAAMAVPTISLYGPTDPGLTGAYGPNQHHLRVDYPCAPCLGRECKKGLQFRIMPPCF